MNDAVACSAWCLRACMLCLSVPCLLWASFHCRTLSVIIYRWISASKRLRILIQTAQTPAKAACGLSTPQKWRKWTKRSLNGTKRIRLPSSVPWLTQVVQVERQRVNESHAQSAHCNIPLTEILEVLEQGQESYLSNKYQVGRHNPLPPVHQQHQGIHQMAPQSPSIR